MEYKKLYEDAIIIAPRERHSFFYEYRKQYPSVNFKLMTLEEVESLFSYHYDERAKIYLFKDGKKYNFITDSLKFASRIKDKDYKSEKLKSLIELRKELLFLGYLDKDAYPEMEFSNKNIVVSGCSDLTRLSKALEDVPDLSITMDKVEEFELPKQFHLFESQFEELHYVFNQIAKLIYEGEDINNIYIAGASADYRFLLETYAGMYGLSISGYEEYLYETAIVKDAMTIYSQNDINIDDLIYTLEVQYEEDPNLIEVIRIINTYRFDDLEKDDQLAIYKSIFKNTNCRSRYKDNCIRAINSYYAPPNSKIFFLDFSLGNAPSIDRDDDFLSDNEKKDAGLLTSKDINRIRKNELIAFLKSGCIVSISRPKNTIQGARFDSPLISELNMETIEGAIYEEEYSKAFSQMWLSSILDEEKTYDIYSPYKDAIEKEIGHIKHDDYDSSFKWFVKKLPFDNLTLSPSSINDYFMCPFKYYLTRVLKLEDDYDDLPRLIGDMVHLYLENNFSNNVDDMTKDWHDCMEQILFKNDRKLTPQEAYIFDYMAHQTLLESHWYKTFVKERMNQNYQVFREKKETLYLPNNIKLEGRIDLFLIFENMFDKYFAVFDYKTGHIPNTGYYIHGINLQLPIYALLISSSQDEKIKGSKPLGLYYAPIDAGILKGSDLSDEALNKKYAYIGFTNGPRATLIDKNYPKPDIFKMKKDLSNMLDDQRFSELMTIAKEKAIEAGNRIKDNDFRVNPFDSKEVKACDFCRFNTICYVKDKMKNKVEKRKAVEENEDGEE